MPLVGKKIETTCDNFAHLVRHNCLLVDKTQMIKEFWEGKQVSLITRPRRFGKTLNMTMLQHFFAAKVDGKSTAGLFKDFAIAQMEGGQFLKDHQGQYPVIFITFKDVKEFSYQAAVNQINILIQELYSEHNHLLKSDKIDDDDRANFQRYLDGSVNNAELQHGLHYLSEFLHKACGKKVIILIDEYDSPLTQAYEHGFLDELSNFMRNVFGTALKGNGHLEKGLMLGILRVSQSSMLAGLNNLDIVTVFDKNYQQYFGFTEAEIKELIEFTRATESLEVIKTYYNGYKMREVVVYNPWSAMHFFDKKELAPYWIMTSNDKLLKDVLLNSSKETKQQLGDLMQGKAIQGEVNINLSYEDLIEKPHTLWTLLLFCGYLTIESSKLSNIGTTRSCQLRIPNQEVLVQYTEIFSDWLKEKMGARYNSFLRNLVEGKAEEFTRELSDYLMQSLSFRDVDGDKKSERFYHSFTTGLIASLRHTHHLDSNKESGFGLFDVILTPKSLNNPLSIILEFKHAKTQQNPEIEARDALKQIDQLKYDTVLTRYPHIKTVLKVGLAFCKKSVISAYKKENLLTRSNSDIILSQEYCRDPDIYDNEDNSQSKEKSSPKKRPLDEADVEEKPRDENPPESQRPKKEEVPEQSSPYPAHGVFK